MAETTSAGAKIYIGPANATANNEAAYALLDYTEIGKVVDIPEFGISFDPVTTDQLSDRLTKTFKGQKKAGTPTIVYDHDAADSGQVAVGPALASDDEYAIKITLDDAGSGSPSSPTTFYFRALIMSQTAAIGTSNNMFRRHMMIAINSVPVEVAAV